jgi:hypothetical protein
MVLDKKKNLVRLETEIIHSNINQFNDGSIKLDELIKRIKESVNAIEGVMKWK